MSIPETREERVPGFHENAEIRFETVIDSPFAILASRRAAQKRKNTHFFRRNSVSVCCFLNDRFLEKSKPTHFCIEKSVSFYTFWRRGARRKSQTDYLVLSQIAFPRFRENRNSILACFRNRNPLFSGIRFLKRARIEFLVFTKTRKCDLRQ